MKRIVLNAAALCFLTTVSFALPAAAEGNAEHRKLDPSTLKALDQALIARQQAEIEKRYPKMLFKPEMMAKMMGEMALQNSMRNAVQPAIMSMIMGMLVENNSPDQQNERQDAMNKLRDDLIKIQQDAMNNMHAQAPMQNQMRAKMVEEIGTQSTYLQYIFMPRQKFRTISEFHSGTFVRDQMKTKAVPLPGTEPAHLVLNPEKAEGGSSN